MVINNRFAGKGTEQSAVPAVIVKMDSFFWLRILDVFYTLLHFLIIGFNLLGWIWKATRQLHFYSVVLTAASWLLLGIWFGVGYCPITDWQWAVKTKLGEKDLPDSFIKYQADRLAGSDFSPILINWITAISFAVVTLIAVYFRIIKKLSKTNT